jgi:hypothetical protein
VAAAPLAVARAVADRTVVPVATHLVLPPLQVAVALVSAPLRWASHNHWDSL